MLDAVRLVDPGDPLLPGARARRCSGKRARDAAERDARRSTRAAPTAWPRLYGHWITVNYRESYGLFACSGILFNHESPRRGREFVTRKISEGVARIKLGLAGRAATRQPRRAARLGLRARVRRRHVAHAAAADERRRLRDRHRRAPLGARVRASSPSTHVGLDPDDFVRTDPTLLRPAEVDTLLADPTKAREQLGWRRADPLRRAGPHHGRGRSRAQERDERRAPGARGRDEPARARARDRRGGLHRLDARRSPARARAARWSGSTPSTPSTREAQKRRNLSGALRAPRLPAGRAATSATRAAVGALFAERRFDAVVHLAALAGVRPSLERPGRVRRRERARHRGAARSRPCAHGVARVVFASSSSVYGERARRAVPRDRSRRAADLALRRDQARRRAARAQLPRTRTASASRARASSPPTGRASARPGDPHVRRAHAARRADPGLRRRLRGARLHLRRRSGATGWCARSIRDLGFAILNFGAGRTVSVLEVVAHARARARRQGADRVAAARRRATSRAPGPTSPRRARRSATRRRRRFEAGHRPLRRVAAGAPR